MGFWVASLEGFEARFKNEKARREAPAESEIEI